MTELPAATRVKQTLNDARTSIREARQLLTGVRQLRARSDEYDAPVDWKSNVVDVEAAIQESIEVLEGQMDQLLDAYGTVLHLEGKEL